MIRRFTFLFALGLWLGACSSPSPDQPEQLPQIHLFGADSLDFGDKKPLRISYVDEFGQVKMDAEEGKARLRGGYSMRYPKHSFTIRTKWGISPAGLPEDRDWILNAAYADKSLSRNAVSYAWFRSFSKKNRAPKTGFVEVYLDSNYYGVFVATERVDAEWLGLDRFDRKACLFKEPLVFRDQDFMDNYPHPDTSNLNQQKYPKLDDRDFNAEMEQLRRFIFESSGAEFTDPEKGIGHYFDLDNIIDWQLLLMATNNGDGITKNFYLYRQDRDTPFRIVPWDYDATFGRDGDNEPNDHGVLEPRLHVFFQRLWDTNPDQYRERLTARYRDLKEKGLIDQAVVSEALANHRAVLGDAAQCNAERWPIDASDYFDAYNLAQEHDFMVDWLGPHLKALQARVDSL